MRCTNEKVISSPSLINFLPPGISMSRGRERTHYYSLQTAIWGSGRKKQCSVRKNQTTEPSKNIYLNCKGTLPKISSCEVSQVYQLNAILLNCTGPKISDSINSIKIPGKHAREFGGKINYQIIILTSLLSGSILLPSDVAQRVQRYSNFSPSGKIIRSLFLTGTATLHLGQ